MHKGSKPSLRYLFIALVRQHRQGHDEGRSLSKYAPGCYEALVMFDHFGADGQTHSVPAKFVLSVETLERLEDEIEVFFIKADTIVADADFPFSF